MSNQKRPKAKKQLGFTLVELLVVIGIIALLISILLPALSKAKKAANAAKCLANLHSIGNAMQIYATNNGNYIPGSPNTTGRFLLSGSTYSNNNSPGIVQIFDWMSPLCDTMGVRVPYSGTADAGRSNGQARWDRVNFQLSAAMFNCPENAATCTLYQGTTAFPSAANVPGFVPYLSYCSSMMFMVVSNPNPSDSSNPTLYGNVYANPPASYSPKLNKVGASANKIFVSDGARYVKLASNDFDMDFSYAGSVGGAYSDWGSYTTYSNGRPRSPAASGVPDSRTFWERHGGVTPGTYKFNAVFFDGHAAAVSDLEGSNPNLWAPTGTTIARTEFWPDTLKKYVTSTGPYIVGD